jgi:hypothetical protein
MGDVRKMMYSSGKSSFHDFKLIADGKDIPIHKAIIAARSLKFESMLRACDSESGQLVLTDISYTILESFVHFMYTAELNPERNREDDLKLLQAAHAYDLAELRTMLEDACVTKLRTGSYLDPVEHLKFGEFCAGALNVADTISSSYLRLQCLHTIASWDVRRDGSYLLDEMDSLLPFAEEIASVRKQLELPPIEHLKQRLKIQEGIKKNDLSIIEACGPGQAAAQLDSAEALHFSCCLCRQQDDVQSEERFVIDLDMVQKIIDAGADVNARNQYSHTSLHVAAEVMNPSVVERLLANGANPILKTEQGKTALNSLEDAIQDANAFAASVGGLPATTEAARAQQLKERTQKERVAQLLSAAVDELMEKEAKVLASKAKAADLLKAGDSSAALDLYGQVAKQTKCSLTAAQCLGNCSLIQLQLGKNECALVDADKAVAADPGYNKAHWRRAKALDALGRVGEAKQAEARYKTKACSMPPSKIAKIPTDEEFLSDAELLGQDEWEEPEWAQVEFDNEGSGVGAEVGAEELHLAIRKLTMPESTKALQVFQEFRRNAKAEEEVYNMPRDDMHGSSCPAEEEVYRMLQSKLPLPVAENVAKFSERRHLVDLVKTALAEDFHGSRADTPQGVYTARNAPFSSAYADQGMGDY